MARRRKKRVVIATPYPTIAETARDLGISPRRVKELKKILRKNVAKTKKVSRPSKKFIKDNA